MRYLAPQMPRPEVTQTVVSPFCNVPHEHSYIASVIHDNGHTCPRWVWPLTCSPMPARPAFSKW